MKEISVNLSNNGKIVGLLRKVKNPKGLVILVHGFPGSIKGPAGTSWIKLSKALARKKFDVYRFNFRFTSPRWNKFHKMTISGEVNDLKLILRKFAKQYKRIGLVGESLGGAISVSAYNKKMSCLVLWYPVIDWPRSETLTSRLETPSALHELNTKGYVTIEKSSTGAPIRVGKKFVEETKKLILYSKVRKITCPTLIVSPCKDTIVPFWQSEKYLKLLKTKDKTLLKVKNSDHAWWKFGRNKRDWAGERLAIVKTTEWFNEWLK